MAEMTELTIQIDAELKEKAEILFNRAGVNVTSVIQRFVEKCVNDGIIPVETIEEDFDLDGPYTFEEEALFYSPSNVAAILKAAKSLDEGKGIVMTIDELHDFRDDILSCKGHYNN